MLNTCTLIKSPHTSTMNCEVFTVSVLSYLYPQKCYINHSIVFYYFLSSFLLRVIKKSKNYQSAILTVSVDDV